MDEEDAKAILGGAIAAAVFGGLLYIMYHGGSPEVLAKALEAGGPMLHLAAALLIGSGAAANYLRCKKE